MVSAFVDVCFGGGGSGCVEGVKFRGRRRSLEEH